MELVEVAARERVAGEDDDLLVLDAIAARQAAEAEENHASASRWREADAYRELSERGWTQKRIARACGVSQSTVSRFIKSAKAYAVPHRRPSFWHGYAEVTGERTGFGLNLSRGVEWYTPVEYVEAARAVLGGIDLDPASCEEANQTVRATRFYTKAQDGLSQPWSGRVWLNPPYGHGLTGPFVTRCVEEHAAGRVEAAIVVVNGYTGNAGWFQPLYDGLLCFAARKVEFVAPGGVERGGSTFGNVFAYLGPEPGRFAREFSQFGAVMRNASHPNDNERGQ